MFSPFRLLTMGVLAIGVYMGFYAVPPGTAGSFDPVAVAQHETAAWQAGRVRDERAALVNSILYFRELHRMSWFRAAQNGFTLSRMLVQLPHMTGRYDRLLPGIQEIARSEKAWKGGEFDAEAVATLQLSWMTAARNPRPNGDSERIVSEMSEEFAQRFSLRPDQTYGTASGRGEAIRMVLARTDPDWEAVTQLLIGSYTNLKLALDRASAPSY